jgi:predicted transcriptional regulator
MTALQSEVILWKLSGYTENYIAKQLGINQSAVNQRANSAGWNAINTLVQRFEKLYTYE